VPDSKDLEKISKMLGEIGEKELEIGEIREEEIPGLEGEGIPGEEEEEPEVISEEVLPTQAVPVEGAPEEPAREEGEDEFAELLKDIEIGLKEEKEFEEKISMEGKEEEAHGLPEVPEADETEEVIQPAEEKREEEIPLSASIEYIPEEEEEAEIGEGLAVKEEEAEEGGLDLPEDFEMDNLTFKEGPPEELMSAKKAAPEPAPEAPEEAVEIPEEPALEEFEIPEAPEEAVEIPQAPEKPAEPEPSVEEYEMPDLEDLESLESVEEAPVLEVEAVTEVPEVIEAPEEAEVKRAGLPEEARIDLSDEDIILIKTKLKQINPQLASYVRDVIIKGTLPVLVVNTIINLLIKDAPEEEITKYIEGVIGKKIVPERLVPGVITVERKPGILENLYQNIAPLIRIAALFVVILAILSILFMVFVYKPMKAARYYREGVEFIQNEQYDQAEQSFTRAIGIYERVKEYDRFGWEYMISGNYEAARKKLETGIAKDSDVKNIDIRLHMAKLHNVLGEFPDADRLYDEVIAKEPGKYEYVKLKGVNLIDWGEREEESHLDDAYILFENAFSRKPKNSDPLFKMLSIKIFQKKQDDIGFLYAYLSERFPQDVDKEVYTDLASYYISQEIFGQIRDILMGVLQGFPEYPPAYYAFADYYKEIRNRNMQEEFLHTAVESENRRELHYPWEKRDRELLSNAYNDLGEIYAEGETPGIAAEAINYFKKAVDQNSKNVKAYFNLAEVYFYKEKNYPLATRYYEKAEAGGFVSNDLDYNLGLLYFYKKSFLKALTRWSALSEVVPDNAYIGTAMGSAFLYLEKYNAALGELLVLSEFYDDLIKNLGEIKPWRAYHKRILLEAAAVNNNLGVAYEKLSEINQNPEYQRESLVFLYKAGELADIMGTERGKIQYNINYIIHPEVIRGDMAINDDLSDNYRFYIQ